ncbi:MAG TPA: ribosome small subunit-dependent GTPase A [Pilimelia sp.]|nr:ribosome small subunit-dependent GTPase A [Pilimelia sp.]
MPSLGWDATFAAAYREHSDSDHRPGRALRVDRGVCTVLTADGALRASVAGGLLSAATRDPVALPCAGDWLVVRRWPDDRLTVEAVLPRRTAVVRRTAGATSTGQVLAANVDAAAVVEPMHPAADVGRIERLLALAWESGAQPLVVLTKADLVPDPAAAIAEVAAAAPGVAVVAVAAERGDGLAELRPLVAAGHTLALLGPSGAGKSTLVNALAGAAVMGTQAIRRVDGKGRHTTTYRALVPVPGGGAVLDTPGVRAVGLLDTAEGLDQAFADVSELVALCRFADCRHDSEPGCAVRAALESGDLPPRRYESWQKLQREMAYEARRRDARLAAQERDRWKRIHKEQRLRTPRR